MTISAADVRHIARLARLDLTDEEIERFRAELSAILEYVARIEPLATGRGAGVGKPRQPLREDRAELYPDRVRLQDEAPDFLDGFFRVPRVVE